MSIKKTIVIEDKLAAMFDYLPEVKTFKPMFKVGDEKELLLFFRQSERSSNYPLIWLVQPYEEQHINRKRVNIRNLSLILAVQTNYDLLNAERMVKTFPILYELLDNILDVFTQSNTLSFNLKYSIVKFPNYDHSETLTGEGSVVDIWDAIKLTLDVEINDNCLKPINI